MSKKLWAVLLLLTLMLGSVSIFWSRPALANTRPKVLLCTAEPWGHIEDKTPHPTDDEPWEDLEAFINTNNFSYTNDSPLSSRPSRPDGVDPEGDNGKAGFPSNWRFCLIWLCQLFFR